jgi:hypothetical protein
MDYILAAEFFILGILTGVMILSDIIEWIDRGNRSRTSL